MAPLRSIISGPGIITPAAAGDWTIYPPETGRVAELPKAEGEAVQPGDILVRFDFANIGEEISARQADLLTATQRVDTAKADATKMAAMFDRGFVARNEYDAAKGAVVTAEADVTRARQALDAANSASERAVVKARFAGVVAKRFHNQGDLVNGSTSDPVLRVIDPTRVQIAMSVSLQQLEKILPGLQATVTTPTGIEPATVVLRPAGDDPRATSQEVRLAFTNPTTSPVDSPVQVEILLDQRPSVVSLPNAAVLKGDNGQTFVMIAGADGRAHWRDVRVGLATADRTEILSGVTPGDVVIVKNLSLVTDGALITTAR